MRRGWLEADEARAMRDWHNDGGFSLDARCHDRHLVQWNRFHIYIPSRTLQCLNTLEGNRRIKPNNRDTKRFAIIPDSKVAIILGLDSSQFKVRKPSIYMFGPGLWREMVGEVRIFVVTIRE